MRYPTLALSLALLPLAAGAEGARQVFDCRDAAGVAIGFTLAPQDTDAAGAGRIAIAWPGGEAAGVAASHQGPWAWAAGEDRYALAVDRIDGTEAQLLFHHLPAGAAAGALTRLTCEARF